MIKIAARMLGAGAFLDAASELAGVSRSSIRSLVSDAEASLSDSVGDEFWTVSGADRNWAREVLARAYHDLASSASAHTFLRSVLTSPEAIASLVNDRVITLDGDGIDTAGEDARAYLRALSQSMAHLVSMFYTSDPDANRQATATAVGEILQTVRTFVSQRNESAQVTSRTAGAPVTWEPLRVAGIAQLSKVPEYYPATFDSERLGGALRLVNIGNDTLSQFDGRGIYWAGHVPGESSAIVAADVSSGELVVILGNPGSGKSTLARALTVQQLRTGTPALYCRLEDVASVSAQNPDSDAVTVSLMAYAQAIRRNLSRDDAAAIAAEWADQHKTPLVVMDGLDELPTAQQYDRARDVSLELTRMGHPVLLTSRLSGYTRGWAHATRHVWLAPLDEETQTTFAGEWFSTVNDPSSRDRYQAAVDDGRLGDTLSSPLTLGFVCWLAQYDAVPLSSGEVFDRFIDHFLRAPWKAPTLQRSNVTEVGALKAAAERVAWSMANRLAGDGGTEWADVDTLADQARRHATTDPYALFATGLLVPQGAVEPQGATQQTVRWLHRAIQENLVATHLREMVRTNVSGWEELVYGAVLRPLWQGAEQQLVSLLREGPETHAVMDLLTRVLNEDGDGPSAYIGARLAQITSMCCTCKRRKTDVARMLCGLEQWVGAYRTEPTVALRGLRDALAHGTDIVDQIYLARDLLSSRDPDAWDVIELLASTPHPDPVTVVCAAAVEAARYPDQPPTRYLACAADESTRFSLWSIGAVSAPQRAAVVDWIVSRVSTADPEAHLDLIEAWSIVNDAFGRDDAQHILADYPQLKPVVEVGTRYDVIDHDFTPIMGILAGPFSEREEAFFGSHLSSLGRWTGRFSTANVSFGSVEMRQGCGCAVAQPSEPVPLSATSQQLALEIVRTYLQVDDVLTLNQTETLLWALEALRAQPTTDACELLLRLRQKIFGNDGRHAFSRGYIDANFLYAVDADQPWDALAATIRMQPTGDPNYDGYVLTRAAILAASPVSTGVTLSEDFIIDYFQYGSNLLLSADVPIEYVKDFQLPEGLHRDDTRRVAATVIARCRTLHDSARKSVEQTVSNDLYAADLLYEFYRAISTRKPAPH